MARRIGSVSFFHCPRDANRVAHNLTRCTYDSNVVYNWNGDPPSFVISDIISDVIVI